MRQYPLVMNGSCEHLSVLDDEKKWYWSLDDGIFVVFINRVLVRKNRDTSFLLQYIQIALLQYNEMT
jgi:hypothetical protein